jgi:hypothetical protein
MEAFRRSNCADADEDRICTYMAKHSLSILELAKKGATHRYQELKAELAELAKAFPHLRYGSAVSPAMPDAVEEPKIQRRRKRSKMSAGARKAVSVRMKKYWAARRKEKVK